MFRREALRKGVLTPIRAKVGIYAGPLQMQGHAAAPAPGPPSAGTATGAGNQKKKKPVVTGYVPGPFF